MFSFGHCPKRGGGRPLPEFFDPVFPPCCPLGQCPKENIFYVRASLTQITLHVCSICGQITFSICLSCMCGLMWEHTCTGLHHGGCYCPLEARQCPDMRWMGRRITQKFCLTLNVGEQVNKALRWLIRAATIIASRM